MSDFDKEAEREKLREKYEQEEENREATEQMSELLLKGATMTNAHCNDCGDPIFRYDGQEFCPTCKRPVDRQDGDASGQTDDVDAAEAEEAPTQGDNIEVTEPSDDATVQFGGQGNEGDETTAPDQSARADDERAGQQRTAAPREQQGSVSRDTPPNQPRRAPSLDPAATRDPVSGEGSGKPGTGESTASTHLSNARLVLAQTVEQYAHRAQQADDPRDAREYLDAAREAAETLEATQL